MKFSITKKAYQGDSSTGYYTYAQISLCVNGTTVECLVTPPQWAVDKLNGLENPSLSGTHSREGFSAGAGSTPLRTVEISMAEFAELFSVIIKERTEIVAPHGEAAMKSELAYYLGLVRDLL